MKDEKRVLRVLKRDLKRAGNRQRRRHLKDLDAEPDDFEFGRNRTDIMNADTRERSKQRRGSSAKPEAGFSSPPDRSHFSPLPQPSPRSTEEREFVALPSDS